MAAARKSGAKAPASRPVTVRGLKIEVNDEFVNSWRAFELMLEFNRDDIDVFRKLALSFELIEEATDITKEEIVEAVGGPMSPAEKVMETASEIMQEVFPKN